MVVPCVGGLSKSVARVMKKQTKQPPPPPTPLKKKQKKKKKNTHTHTKTQKTWHQYLLPNYTLRKAIFYPEDKMEKENTCCVMYKILIRGCELKCMDYKGRFGAGLGERRRRCITGIHQVRAKVI